MCGLERGLEGLTRRVGSGCDRESAPLSPPQLLALLTGWGGVGEHDVCRERGECEVSGWPSPPPWFSGKPGTVLGEPRSTSFFCQCPAGISQALSLGSCAFRTACGPPFSRGPSPSDPSPQPPPPGTPHPAGSPAWAGPRPEGLHQRACSVSSADPWTEAAALPPGMQDPVRPGGKRGSPPPPQNSPPGLSGGGGSSVPGKQGVGAATPRALASGWCRRPSLPLQPPYPPSAGPRQHWWPWHHHQPPVQPAHQPRCGGMGREAGGEGAGAGGFEGRKGALQTRSGSGPDGVSPHTAPAIGRGPSRTSQVVGNLPSHVPCSLYRRSLSGPCSQGSSPYLSPASSAGTSLSPAS